MRTVPVKYSAGPLPEGCEPLLFMSMCSIPPVYAYKSREECSRLEVIIDNLKHRMVEEFVKIIV
jgi:hypothetical protein